MYLQHIYIYRMFYKNLFQLMLRNIIDHWIRTVIYTRISSYVLLYYLFFYAYQYIYTYIYVYIYWRHLILSKILNLYFLNSRSGSCPSNALLVKKPNFLKIHIYKIKEFSKIWSEIYFENCLEKLLENIHENFFCFCTVIKTFVGKINLKWNCPFCLDRF